MLRRPKRKAPEAVAPAEDVEAAVLGSDSEGSGDEGVDELEKFVLGDDEDITEQLTKPVKSGKQSKSRKVEVERKPAWEDEDDEKEVSLRVEHNKMAKTILFEKKKKKLSGKEYTMTLKQKYIAVTGTPAWADLDREKTAEEDDDSDDDNLAMKAGNYLAEGRTLPRHEIRLKRCKDANNQKPCKDKLTNVEFHPTATVMLAAGLDQRLSIFQVDGKDNPEIHSVFLDKFPVHTAHFSQDGNEVVLASIHKGFYYFDMIEGAIHSVPWIKGIEENCMKNFKVSPDGKYLVFRGKSGHIHFLTAKTKEWIDTKKMNGYIKDLAFYADGSKMATYGDEGEVYIWDMNTRDCIHRFTDEGAVNGLCVDVSPNGQYLACGSNTGVVSIYDTEKVMTTQYPKPIKAIMNMKSPCTRLKFNSTSEILCSMSNLEERAVKLIHTPSMTTFSNYPRKREPLARPFCVDFSLNSGYLTIGDSRGHALLYRVNHYKDY